MIRTSSIGGIIAMACAAILHGNDDLDRARALEKSGDAQAARAALVAAIQTAPEDVQVLTAYAEFLDRYADPESLSAYRKLLGVLQKSGDFGRAAGVSRRIVLLDLVGGDRAAALRDLAVSRAAGGPDWPAPPNWKPGGDAAAPGQSIRIPGPLRSFARMAAIPGDIAPEDVLPALARNVVTNGYQVLHSNEGLEQTEYLKLVHRYLSQARELEKVAGADRVIRIETCESAKAGELLRVIGYRMRGGCGSEVVLETVNATRAFLTTDSGFPLAELEQALRTNRPFAFDYQPAVIPVLYGPDYWLTARDKNPGELIDLFLSDPALCRLYLGLSKLERNTAEELRKAVPLQRIKAYAHVLDFFGGMFELRDGKAMVPGGARSAAAWTELVGVSPDQGSAFFERLLARDDGWMASLFDSLARISGPVQEYLSEPNRMKRFYAAVRGRVTSPGPARPVFRSNSDMILLTTRLRVDARGRAVMPGGVEVWKNLFTVHPNGKYDGKLVKAAAGWKDEDDVVEALFALCRKVVENQPLRIFMAISDLDRHRTRPLEAATVTRLVMAHHAYGAQYSVFNDAPSVSDKTILEFLDAADALDRIRDTEMRADALGTMQALVGIWQILCRQGGIAGPDADRTLSALVTAFPQVRRNRDLFEAGRNGLKLLLAAAHVTDGAAPQERMVELLSGTAHPNDADAQGLMIQDMNRILDAQRLISLNQLFQLDAQLDGRPAGTKLDSALISRIASRIGEVQLPRSTLTGVERNSYSYGYWTERHVETQRKLNLRAAIERAGADAEKLREVRGLLAPLLRDTLVGLNYAHYAPPGAQVLFTNPAFVRGHDFIGVQGATNSWKATEPFGTGWPSNGGGRLAGSLSGLPYALAEAEQNFLVPLQTQALIWGDLVPQMILSAKIPRWWNVTPQQMHWVGLHFRYARGLLGEAALDAAVRARVLDVISAQAPPARTRQVGRLLEEGDVRSALERLTPSELFVLAGALTPAHGAAGDPVAAELQSLPAAYPDHVNYAAISRAFGTPKPTLTNSYRPELLNLRTFPTLMGYSSRIMAESWESNTLYWVALADEMHTPPALLNLLIPEWTQLVVERIFASHLEDWPALLRSLRTVGEDVRAKSRTQAAGEQKASLQ